jgi:hypothetical protein
VAYAVSNRRLIVLDFHGQQARISVQKPRLDGYFGKVADGDSCRLAENTASDLSRIFTSKKLVAREHSIFSCQCVQNFNQKRSGSNHFTFESNIISKIIRALECLMKSGARLFHWEMP